MRTRSLFTRPWRNSTTRGSLWLASVFALLAHGAAARAQLVPTAVIGAAAEDPKNKILFNLPVNCSSVAPGDVCILQYANNPEFNSRVWQNGGTVYGLQKGVKYYFHVASGRYRVAGQEYKEPVFSPTVTYEYGQGNPPSTTQPSSVQIGSSSCSGMAGATLKSASSLAPGSSVYSPNQRYRLAYQTDGNLVVYDVAYKKALWASNTSNVAPKQLVMQADGNVVMLKTDNTVAWSTKTSGNAGAVLSMQDDGNLVVYKKDSCNAAWARR